jgi:stress response protein YsnF
LNFKKKTNNKQKEMRVMRKLFIMKRAILVSSAGLLLTACSSTGHEQSHASYSTTGASQDGWMPGSWSQHEYSSAQSYSVQPSSAKSYSAQPIQQDQNNIVIPLHEEQVKVGKRTVDAGQVTIRKTVTTQTVSEPVELRKETLVIERDGSQVSSDWQKGGTYQSSSAPASVNEPAGASTGSGAAFQAQSYTFRLQKEEPVVEKTIVQSGQVTARKSSQIEQQTIQQQVRKEDVQFDKGGANVQIQENSGNQLSEPSGAQAPAPYINESTDSSTQNRAPTKGQGVQDLKHPPQ